MAATLPHDAQQVLRAALDEVGFATDAADVGDGEPGLAFVDCREVAGDSIAGGSGAAGRSYVIAIVGSTEGARQALAQRADDALVLPLEPAWVRARLEHAERVMARGEYRRAYAGNVQHVDRMLGIGALVAGVAHELNTPLAYVMSNVEYGIDLLKRRSWVSADEIRELREALREAYEGSERMREIVRDLRTFSRGRDDLVAPVDVHRVLDSAIKLCIGELRPKARLTKNFLPMPAVVANESRLGQVFLNLLLNAAQAILPSDAAKNEITVATRTADDGTAVIEIADTGCGIASEDLARVFEAFYTTKPSGTGLGLAICRSIVESLAGNITVTSTLGLGTTIRVELPPSSEPAVQSERPSYVPPPRRGRVLAIDDEPFVGRALARLLMGHDVVCAASAEEALTHLFSPAQRFDAILCDVTLGDATGKDVYDALVSRSPAAIERMAFMTGGAPTPELAAFLELAARPVLEKPFDSTRVRALVLELVGP